MTHGGADLLSISVNGEPRLIRPGTSVTDLLAERGLGGKTVAVERNRRIVDTSNYESVRRPIHGEAVDRWRRYERHLEPLRRGLAGLPPE